MRRITTSRWVRGGGRLPAAVLVALALITAAVVGESPAADAAASAPSATCTTPSTVDGFTPHQLAQRYGIDDLVAKGADGRGVTIAILEFGESADLDVLTEWAACQGVDPPSVTQTLVRGSTMPGPSMEAQGDVEVVAGLVPGANVHVLVSDTGSTAGLAPMIDSALDPSNTGGHPVDVIVSSYGECEAHVPAEDMQAGDAALARMAEAGVWFLKSAGDAGSDECAPHGVPCSSISDPAANVEYPTSNPNVTGVGGTQVLDARTEGEATVWKQTGDCSAGGGGFSTRFGVPAFQQGFGPAGTTQRMLPDVSGLAGHPGYQLLGPTGSWAEMDGTSFAAPMYAAGMAAVISELRGSGLSVPANLNDVLYEAAGDPATYVALFTDVLTTDNDLLGVGCCTAGVGYDTASGLGELRFDAFAGWLVAQAGATADDDPDQGGAPPAADPTAVVVVPSFTG